MYRRCFTNYRTTEDLGYYKLGNIKKIVKLGGDIAWCLSSFSEDKFCKKWSKQSIYAYKSYIKVFWSDPGLLDYCNLFRILLPGLQSQKCKGIFEKK